MRGRGIAGDEGVLPLGTALSQAASLTVYMCWHGGRGHGYSPAAMEAARRLRERHLPQAGSDEEYTALTFPASPQDVQDFETVAPFCDLGYVVGASGEVLAEVHGQDHGDDEANSR